MFNVFTPKVQTVGSVRDFLAQNKTVKEVTKALPLATATTIPLTYTPAVSASLIGDRVISAFDPIIQLLQAMAYPLGFLMMTAGCLVIMTGNKSRGIHLIKWAAIGFIGMQFLPGIMQILAEVGEAIAK